MKTLKTICLAASIGFIFTACENETIEKTTNNNSQSEEVTSDFTEEDFNLMVSEIEKEDTETNLKSKPEVQTVDYVDLNKYTGRWYEIAKYPNLFTLGCTCTTADYGLNDDGKSVSVFNNCTIAFTDFKNNINGNATVVDTETNAKLKVKFPSVPGPAGDYWIIDLVDFDDNTPYDFSVVTDPKRENLFILSRTPYLDTYKKRSALRKILRNLKKQKFSLFKLQVSPQFDNCEYPE